tara:strand:- start:468 stop:1259 length:792 start_codon:yes stop_codon:yes gene_type:complete
MTRCELKIVLVVVLIIIITCILSRRVKPCTYVARSVPVHQSNTIPKILFQTSHYPRDKIPFNKLHGEFTTGYKYFLYDDAMCDGFIQQHFSKKTLDQFRKLKGPHKADLWRYCALYVHGGVYADIKTVFLTHLDNIFPSGPGFRWYAVIGYTGSSVYNGIIATPPKNPMMLDLIDHCTNNYPKYYLYYVNSFLDMLKKRYRIEKVNKTEYSDDSSTVRLYHEKCNTEKECSLVEKRDRYNYCCNIYADGDQPIISTRDPDYPW